MSNADKIEACLAALPSEKRAVLADWRARIKALAPDATETFSYAMPAFKIGGKGLVAYAAAKSHFGYYPMSGRTVATLGDKLKALKTSSGAVQFTTEKPLTDTLLKLLIDARRAEIEGRK